MSEAGLAKADFEVAISRAAGTLLLWAGEDREDAQRNYIRQQLRALQVMGHLEPLDAYQKYETSDKSIIDPRSSDVACFAAQNTNIKGVTTLRSGRMHIWFGVNSRVKNLLVNSDLARCCLIIGPNTEIDDVVIQFGPGAASVVIGSGVTMAGTNFLIAEDEGYVVIGDDCMFSTGVTGRTTDSHGIYDTQTRQLINQGKPIILHKHVWIGRGVSLGKGSEVGQNSVLGQGALTSGVLPAGGIYVGQPARQLRGNVTWDRTQAETLDKAEAVHPSRTRQWNHLRLCERIDALGDQPVSDLTLPQTISRLLATSHSEATIVKISDALRRSGDPEGAILCEEAQKARQLGASMQVSDGR